MINKKRTRHKVMKQYFVLRLVYCRGSRVSTRTTTKVRIDGQAAIFLELV